LRKLKFHAAGTGYAFSLKLSVVQFILLPGKTDNVVKDGLRSALPLAKARKPNNHIGGCQNSINAG